MKKRALLTILILAVLMIFMNLFVSWKNIPVSVSDSDIRQSVNKSFLDTGKKRIPVYGAQSSKMCGVPPHNFNINGRCVSQRKRNTGDRFIFN